MSKNKVGKPKRFKTAKELHKSCMDYFEWADNNPDHINDFIRSGKGAGTPVQIPVHRPYTKQELANYLGITIKTLWNYKEYGEEYLQVLTQVEEIIQANQLRGAMVGKYNSSIVSRLLGLHDKQDITMSGKQGENTEPIQIEVIHTNQNFEGDGSNSTE